MYTSIMASKALLALSLFLVMFAHLPENVRGAGHPETEASSEHTSGMNGDEYAQQEDKKPSGTKHRTQNTDGMPMMCYEKKSEMKRTGKGNKMGNSLMEQSAKLLSMVMRRIENGEELDMKFMQETAEKLQNMTSDKKEEEDDDNTELGLELMGIVDRLMESGEMGGGETAVKSAPMHDEHGSSPASFVPSIPPGIDLSSFGLTTAELLSLLQDPTRAFIFESLGLAPFITYLQDEEIVTALSQLDIDTFNAILLSGDIFTSDGQVNMKFIRNLIGDFGDEETNDSDEMELMNETTTMTDHQFMNIFQQILSILGIEDKATPDNLVPALLQAIQVIVNANDSTVDELITILSEITQEDIEMWGEMNEGKSLNMMREENSGMMIAFEAILALAGVEGNVTEENIMESFITALRFVATAEEPVLVAIFEMIGDMDLTTAMGRSEQKENGEQDVMQTFQMLMQMAGVEGEVTEQNLTESIMTAMQYILSADEESLTAIIELMDGLNFGPDSSMEDDGMTGMQGQNDSVNAMFDRIMALAGVGEVTETNLMESVLRALRFLMNADEETINGIVKRMGDMGMSTSGAGSKQGALVLGRNVVGTTATFTTPSMSMGDRTISPTESTEHTDMDKMGEGTDVMEIFKSLLKLTGVESEITEENLMESIMKAMQYILSADEGSLTAIDALLERLDFGSDMSMGMGGTSEMDGQTDSVTAMFDRILALAGVGEVTETNLMESVVTALRFLMNADEATINGIVKRMGEMGMSMTGLGREKEAGVTPTSGMVSTSSGKGTTDMETMSERTDVMEIFETILRPTGNQGEVTEDNVIEKTLMAMNFILQADRDQLAIILQELSKINFGESMRVEMEHTNESENDTEEMLGKDGLELICYPMKEHDMNTYMTQSGGKTDHKNVSKEENKEHKESTTMKPVKDVEYESEDAKQKDMGTQQCGSCKSEEELKMMMKQMVESEVSRVVADIVVNMNSVSGISPDVMVVLAKMANGMLPATFEIPTEMPEPMTTSPMVNTEDRWDPWTEYGPCTKTCGTGKRYRTRVCSDAFLERNRQGTDCEETQSTDCAMMDCPPRATEESARVWLSWEEWSPCSVTCGAVGVSTRRRQCVTQLPAESCEQVQTQQCFSGACPTISTTEPPMRFLTTTTAQAPPTTTTTKVMPGTLPFWNEWTDWTPCTLTCGMGVRRRTRTCNQPTSSNCVENDVENCMIRTCPLVTSSPRPTSATPPTAPVFSDWGAWGQCSQPCGGGLRRRSRGCLSGSCVGDFQQIDPCNNVPCSTTRTRIVNPGVVTARTTVLPTTAGTRAPADLSGGSCPQSTYKTLSHQGKCLVFHGRETGMKSFAEYRSYCQQRGGDLLRTVDIEKWVQVAYWMQSIVNRSYMGRNTVAWIGVTDTGDRGRWSHPADRTMSMRRTFMIWMRGEPKAADYDQCAVLNISSGHAISNRCTVQHYAICEY